MSKNLNVMKEIILSMKNWFNKPIEVRTNEAIDVKTNYYIEFEQKIKAQVLTLLKCEGTEIFWNSNGVDVIIRNKSIGCRVLITHSKQRVMWESLQSTDTMPTTETFIEGLSKEIKKFEDSLFDVLCEDILTKRQTRLSNMNDEISKSNQLDISTII